MSALQHARREEIVGRGVVAFAHARARLLAFTFYPPEIVHAPEPIAPGIVLRQELRAGALRFRGPVRVLDVWDEPGRAGFRYEAMPGHVERGIATFEVTLDGEDVRFRIETESAPAHWLARVGAPFARRVQARAVDGAFARMRAACAVGTGSGR